MTEKKKILVIDDEQFSLKTVQACMRGTNYALTLCLDPQEAYSKFKAEQYDVIITDINMNGINGFDLRGLIRNSNKIIPIIFMSSLADNMDSTLMKQITSDRYSYYMNKSFKKMDLLMMIERVLEVPNAQQEIAALKNSIDKDLRLAGQIQKFMLPPWSMVDDDFVMSYIYEPHSQVSGDLHEFFPIGNHRYISVVGDISGHGISAALCMTPIQLFVKNLFASQSQETLTPDFVLTQLNNIFCNNFKQNVYMTCLIVLWDFENDRLIYHSAGHPDMLCLNFKEKQLKQVNPDKLGSLPVGFSPSSPYLPENNVEFEFDDNDLFLAFTDGLFDIGSSQFPESFIEDHELYDFLTSLYDNESTVAIPYLVRNFIEQIGYDCPSDDLFLVAIRKNTSLSKNIFLSQINTDINETNNMLDRVHDYLVASPIESCHKLENDIEILLGEVLINCVQHGKDNANITSNGIIVKIHPYDDKVNVTVLERGVFWDTNRNYSGAEIDKLLDELNDNFSQHGRGLPLIYNIASTVTRMHYHGLNKSVFCIKCNP
jgi:sigma-B regulation protein RsbU (phosphoserine phosphatase)